jgi:glutathione synthase/RimK-type ligase-like ATP-grasp enzyme
MFRLSEQVRSIHNRDGAVVLDIRHGEMFRLNLVGSRMLELLKQGHTEREIAEQVSQEFCVGQEIVALDLREFLAHLEKHHLVEFTRTTIPSAD